jgi:hypothetical protein
MNTDNISDDALRDYMNHWDKACKENVFPPEPKKIKPVPLVTEDESAQNLYWNQLLSDMADTGAINEERTTVWGADNEWRPNPVSAYSLGKDQDHPKVNWGDGVLEIDELKRKLHDLECKLLGKEQVDGKKAIEEPVEQKSGGDFSKEIESLKNKIDELSDRLSNGSVKLAADRSPEDPDGL